MKILVLNSGSSSQKICLYEIGEALPENVPACLWQTKIEWQGNAADVEITNGRGAPAKRHISVSSPADATEQLLRGLWEGDEKAVDSAAEIDMVGHRVVHGGPRFKDPVLITAEVKAAIAGASAFAPLHNGAELQGMESIEKVMGDVPQVAVFDTGFHQNMPLASVVYPGPYEWFDAGIRRYGFHGINHQYCARRAAQFLGRNPDALRLVSCHLGNGCSLAAVRGGKSIDTTMGFTPVEGLMMGTRSGSVDPGILTYLMRQNQVSGEQIDDILNKRSGLLGVSGVSGDMREILAAMKSGNGRAKLALDIYIHRLQSGIGAMIAVLGGIDALIFTAGVGENSAEVRAETCANLAFAGIRLDTTKNAANGKDATGSANARGDRDISTTASPCRILVISAQEDWEIACDCWKLAKRPGDFS
jgi:acetate kinase